MKLKRQRANRQVDALLAGLDDRDVIPAFVTVLELTRLYREADAMSRRHVQEGIAQRQAVRLAGQLLIATGREPAEVARWLQVAELTVRTETPMITPVVVENAVVGRVYDVLEGAMARGLSRADLTAALDLLMPVRKPRAAKATLQLLPAARRRRALRP